MRVILQVTAGPSQGRQIPLQSGEIARFGRSDFADVCFPGDAEMSEVHFELHCRPDGCSVRDVQGSAGTLLNNQPVSEAAFGDGDMILAGQTTLVASVEGRFYQAADDESVSEQEEDEQPENSKPLAHVFCQSIELEDDSLSLLTPELTTEAFIRRLINEQQYADAIRVLSLYLPKRDAILWAHQSVQFAMAGKLTQEEQVAMDAVIAFLKNPIDDHRRNAMEAAEATEFRSGAAWVALSVFWSEGSIAPVGLPDVPPEDHLCGQGVSGALMMTATSGDPSRIQERFIQILKIGQDALDGLLPLPA